MKRREFVAGLGAAVIASCVFCPVATHAEVKMPVIGYLSAGSREGDSFRLTAILQGLTDAGYVEGRNVAIEYRWADDRPALLPELVADLIRRPVDLIMLGTGATARVAKQATATIPIVFVMAGDPVKFDLVASWNRPGGNVTGISYLNNDLLSKRMAMLHAMLPNATIVGLLVHPSSDFRIPEARSAAAMFGKELIVANASSDDEIEKAFGVFIQAKAEALFILDDAFFTTRATRLAALAAKYTLPAIYPLPEFVRSGGLMCYGSSLSESYRQAGIYAGRILKGAKPGELPVMQPTKLDLVINQKTAKALGLQIPDKLIALADEVIE